MYLRWAIFSLNSTSLWYIISFILFFTSYNSQRFYIFSYIHYFIHYSTYIIKYRSHCLPCSASSKHINVRLSSIPNTTCFNDVCSHYILTKTHPPIVYMYRTKETVPIDPKDDKKFEQLLITCKVIFTYINNLV